MCKRVTRKMNGEPGGGGDSKQEFFMIQTKKKTVQVPQYITLIHVQARK